MGTRLCFASGARVRCADPRVRLIGGLAFAAFLVFFLYSFVSITFTKFPKFKPWVLDHLHANLTSWHSIDVTRSRSSSSPTSPLVLHNVTVVTAFLDIGEFGKGSPNVKRDWHIYQEWSSAYSQLQVPVVMYTNSESFASYFLTVRRELLPLTLVVRIDESSLWAFSLKPQIAAIYAAGYPRHWPNTVYPAYTCVTHAKFDLLRDAIEKNYFPSRLIAWMDIGYLRNVAGKNSTDRYVMRPPPDFDPRRVLCGEVFYPDFNRTWRGILRTNSNWVAGGFFLATRDLMNTFVEQYRRAVLSFLHRRESQVEQHILYAMYTKEGRAIVHPTVELQAQHGDWFAVGFSCLQLLKTSLPTTSPPARIYSSSTPPHA